MSDVHAYRPDGELAAALLEYLTQRRTFSATVAEFDQRNPDHQLMWTRDGFGAADDKRAVGFRDGANDVPDGLSRAKTRVELRPKKTKAGRAWQAELDRMNEARPKLGPVLERFGVPTAADGGPHEGLSRRIAPTHVADAGVDGLVVFALGSLERPVMDDPRPLSKHLTPMPLSEFYAIKERIEAEHGETPS